MSLSTLVLAAAALAAAAAQPIVVMSPSGAVRAAPPASDCAPGVEGADIECVLRLTPPERGAEPAPPSRILIRAQWTPKRCAPREAQVVDLARGSLRPKGLPVVEQAALGRRCGS